LAAGAARLQSAYVYCELAGSVWKCESFSLFAVSSCSGCLLHAMWVRFEAGLVNAMRGMSCEKLELTCFLCASHASALHLTATTYRYMTYMENGCAFNLICLCWAEQLYVPVQDMNCAQHYPYHSGLNFLFAFMAATFSLSSSNFLLKSTSCASFLSLL
jgi:hypothetical protein